MATCQALRMASSGPNQSPPNSCERAHDIWLICRRQCLDWMNLTRYPATRTRTGGRSTAHSVAGGLEN